MSIAAAADLALRSSLLLGAAWLAAAMIRSRGGSAATRHGVWMLGLATIAALPLLAWLLPPLPLPVLSAQPVASELPMPVARAGVSAPVQAPPSADLETLLYFAVVGLLLARLALGRALLERIWRNADRLEVFQRETDKACALLGITRKLDVRVGAQATVPMTWGTLRPRILFPHQALAWPPERVRRVLLHELGHVRRLDSLGSIIAQAICAAYWANPLAWYAVRQMRLAQEQACDDVVLSNGGAPTTYARDLVDSACSCRSRPVATAAVAMAGRTDLEKRVRSILAEESRTQPSAIFVGGAAACAALGGVLAAAVVPVHAEAPVAAFAWMPAQTRVSAAHAMAPSSREIVITAPARAEPMPIHVRLAPEAPAATVVPAVMATVQIAPLDPQE